MFYFRIISFLLALPFFFSGCSTLSERKFDISKITFDKNTYPILVLGSGVAGLTAANYIVQANIPCTVIQGDKPGGALAQSSSVRNWPGVIDAPGAEITDSLKQQAEENGAEIEPEAVIKVDLSQWPYKFKLRNLETNEKRWVSACTCIIAMGDTPNYLNVPGETGDNGYWGKGITTCAVCDGSLYHGKEVAVVGGGDAAVEEASYLAGIAKKVSIFVRKDHFRAQDKHKRKETLALPNVQAIYNTEVKEIMGNGKHVTHLKIENNKTGETKKIAMDGLFLAIGSTPNSQVFKGQLNLTKHGIVKLNAGQETSVPGVYAAGDICDNEFKQAVTAAGSACKAALQATAFLEDAGFKEQIIPKRKTKKAPTKVTKKREKQILEKDDVVKTIKNTQEFESLIKTGKLPMVVDLSAKMCFSCKQMEPVFEKLAKQCSEKAYFAKASLSNPDLNISTIISLLQSDPITSVPTFLFIKDGREVCRMQDTQ